MECTHACFIAIHIFTYFCLFLSPCPTYSYNGSSYTRGNFRKWPRGVCMVVPPLQLEFAGAPRIHGPLPIQCTHHQPPQIKFPQSPFHLLRHHPPRCTPLCVLEGRKKFFRNFFFSFGFYANSFGGCVTHPMGPPELQKEC